MSRFTAVFFEQMHVLDAHAAVIGFAYIVNSQQGDLRYVEASISTSVRPAVFDPYAQNQTIHSCRII